MLGRWIDRGGLLFAIGIVASMLILINEVLLRYVFNAPQSGRTRPPFSCAAPPFSMAGSTAPRATATSGSC